LPLHDDVEAYPTVGYSRTEADVEQQHQDVVIQVAGDTGESSEGCHVVVDTSPQVASNGGDSGHDDDNNCCVVCTDPLVWAAVGRCGHRVVCRKCAVRLRFFYRNKRCCICRRYCFRVRVTKADATTTAMSPLLFFAFWEGRVTGKYRYHRHSAAYFEDEEEYKAAKKACEGILAPFYKPVVSMVYLLLIRLSYLWSILGMDY
ncbi:hypothetical protein EJB05_50250, partial [Eragrostis curvula]